MEEPNRLSIPYIVTMSVLMGVGLLLIALWLITFNWAEFLGIVPLTIGALMVFRPMAGSEAASY